ncbi:MAG: SRPBCC family protein [bacterium]
MIPHTPTSTYEQPSDHEVIFSRLLDAPRELVWKVWSDPKHVHEWWGPDGFTTTTHAFEFVPNGEWRHVMHGPDGTDYPTRVVFREIDPPARLVYEHGWDHPDVPLDFKVVVTFVSEAEKTRLSLHMTFANAAALRTAVEHYGVLAGGTQSLDRFAHYVSRGA